jgi:hypothetical protein
MRKLFFIITLILSIHSLASAQVATTHVTGTIYDGSGVPVANARLTIVKVVKGGVVVSTKPVDARSDASGVVSFNILRNSVVYIDAPAVGLNTRPGTGVALTIPDTATATLEALIPATSVTLPGASQSALNTEITNRTTADTSEAATRANADTTLQTNFTNEASARVAGDASTLASANSHSDTGDATEAAARASAIATASTADRARGNHTGSQPASTISDFSTAADARIALKTSTLTTNGLPKWDGTKFVPSRIVDDATGGITGDVSAVPGSEIAFIAPSDGDFLLLAGNSHVAISGNQIGLQSPIVLLGDINSEGNGTSVSITDSLQQVSVTATGGFLVNGTNVLTALAGKAPLSHTHAQGDVTGLVAALAAKEPSITAGTTSQYWRGDKTWQTLSTTNVAEGTNLYFTNARADARITNSAVLAALGFTPANVSHTHAASDVISGIFNVARLPVMVGSGASHAAGIAPDPGPVAGTTKYLREDGTWVVPPDTNSGGTVTSVGLSTPGVFYSVTGSPVTNSGTLALNLINQSANCVFAGPSSGVAAAPSCRALVAADIPSLDTAKLTTGLLAAARGGFGADVSASSGVPLFASGVPTFTSTSGTGNFARVTSPIFVTPTLGVAAATSLTTGNGTAGSPALNNGSNSGIYFPGSSFVGITIAGSSAWYWDNNKNLQPSSDDTSNLGAAASGVKQVFLANTITTPGTTGNQTINKMAGRVNIAAGNSSVTVTDSRVSATSFVVAVVVTNDATAYVKNVVPSAGSFVVTLGAAATAEVAITFVVFN